MIVVDYITSNTGKYIKVHNFLQYARNSFNENFNYIKRSSIEENACYYLHEVRYDYKDDKTSIIFLANISEFNKDHTLEHIRRWYSGNDIIHVYGVNNMSLLGARYIYKNSFYNDIMRARIQYKIDIGHDNFSFDNNRKILDIIHRKFKAQNHFMFKRYGNELFKEFKNE